MQLMKTEMFLTGLGVSQKQWQELQEHSQAARVWGRGLKLLEALGPLLMLGAQPLACLITLVLAFVAPTFAQAPIIGPSTSGFGNTIVRFVQIFYQLVFVIGILGVGYFGIKLVMSGGQEVNWAVLGGSIVCFGASLILSFVYGLARGNTVEIDTTSLGGN